MENLFRFIQSNIIIISWCIVFFCVLLFGGPQWIILMKMKHYYRHKKYDKSLQMATRACKKMWITKAKVACQSYVLACSLALGQTDLFTATLRDIPTTNPQYRSICLSWEIPFLLDQGRIIEAQDRYSDLQHSDNKMSRSVANSYGDIFAYLEMKTAFTVDEVKRRISNAGHPVMVRIYTSFYNQMMRDND